MMDVTEATTVEIKYLRTMALKFTLILFVFWFYLWNREHMYLVWKPELSLIAKALLSADSGILRCIFSRNSTNRQAKWLLIKKSCVANLMFEQRFFFWKHWYTSWYDLYSESSIQVHSSLSRSIYEIFGGRSYIKTV